MKSCDGCALCCKLMSVDHPMLQKPAGHWCVAVKQVGEHSRECSAYNDRPPPCRGFQCLWLLSQSRPGQEMPDELRPDRCHVVFAPDFMVQENRVAGEHLLYAFVDPHRPNAWRLGAKMRGTIDTFLRRGGWAIIKIARKVVILKSGQPPIIGTEDQIQVAAAAFRARYGTGDVSDGLPEPILDPAEFARRAAGG